MTSAQQPEHLSAESGAGESGAVESGAVESGAGETVVGETVVDKASVTVRRSPRYFNFMILGAVIGAITAFILTLAFPANAEFGAAQVFGFLLLAGVALGVTVGAVAAIVIDRVIGRRARTVVVDRLNAQGLRDAGAPDSASGSRLSDQN
ncbi:hypothetical protein [Cryobacterium sp. TMT1-21]|uniref:hypothetical protein n=1 Tax=Cryobacterium sp. TMT1-21 TaxID=1259234 RepID=UPI0015812BF6|nr:hypothetical protein [Cryobacterium sp. TMT1-21]